MDEVEIIESEKSNMNVSRETPTVTATGLNRLAQVLVRHFHEPDLDAVRALLAAIVAHRLNGQPVWPMLVAPPGSMKTELLRALNGCPGVHFIDSVTPKTFISGQIREAKGTEVPSSSLLHRIGTTGILVCADFSTILALKNDDRNAVLSDLRRIYDGELRKEFGTSEVVPAWTGRLTLVVAVTEEIDKQYSVIQSLGDRFLMIRMPRGGEEAALQAMTQDLTAVRQDVKEAVHGVLSAVQLFEPQFPNETLEAVAALADFAARARSYVPHGGPDKAIVGEPQPESATRLAQQLCQLAKGHALLFGRPRVTEADFRVACRVALDCIPPRRRQMLTWVIAGGKAAATPSTKKYDRDDLNALGLLVGADLSPGASSQVAKIRQAGGVFTGTPPQPSEDTTQEVGGNFSEVVPALEESR